MITFFVCIAALIAGYFFYGKFMEKQINVNPENVTPAVRLQDGVDYIPMKPWRIFIIQFLNIAGLGPIFGAIMGAAYGPVAYVWIVFGCIFMGAMHDFFSGMISVRRDGCSIPELVGEYFGNGMKIFLAVIVSFLLLLVGASFVTGPAGLLTQQLPFLSVKGWLYVIFVYYLLATLLPIDKIIGKIYPFFGALLLAMALMVGFMLVIKGAQGAIVMPELTFDKFKNFHSNQSENILIPMLFIVISCGAISGFHSTQSPLMARCMTNEKYGRPIFYGAMICEGIVAIIWATAAIAYCNGPEGLNAALDAPDSSSANVVHAICSTWLGKVGAFIAVLGVIVCPITSGDTALRSLRLTLADAIHYNQKPIFNRILVALPIFVVAYLLCTLDFGTIWKYTGITNQILATAVLWTISMFLVREGKNHLLASIPATFITFVCVSYIMVAPHKSAGLFLTPSFGYAVGIAVALCLFVWFILSTRKYYSTRKTV